MQNGSGFVETSAYNDNGQLELSIDFEGRHTVFTYDTLGRLETKEYFPDAATWNNGTGTPTETVSYTYNSLGGLEDTDDSANGLTTNTYDVEGGLTQVISPEGTVNYDYYPATGRRKSTYTDNTQTDYIYDDLGRLETVKVIKRNGTVLGTAEDTVYTYDLLGNLDKVTLPNGVVSDYDYDVLNRLELLRHFEDANDNGIFDTGESLLAEFDYELLLDGKRSSVTETDEDGNQTYIDWVYDELGRLVFEESYSELLPARNYVDEYQYDLVGNRLTKDHDSNGDGIVDEAITYLYDANDRLLVETRDDLTVADDDGYTLYEYGPNADFTDPADPYGGDHTEQTKKTVYDEATGLPLSQTDNTYNLRGRLESADIKQYDTDGVTVTSQTTTGYTYNDSGIRTSQTVDDGTGAVTTEYVIDGNNLTGYAQVLEEHVDGQLAKTYTIGHDLISQTDATGTVHHFLYDGHGSNRALLDTSGSVVESYAYDAYGNAVGFNAATALTTILYSGEQFDVATDQLYLRARYYDAMIGGFNRDDPYGGNINDPQSLHKYVYAHANPIMGIDPTGEFFATLGALSIQGVLRGLKLGSVGAVGGAIIGAIDAGLADEDMLNGALNGAKWGGAIGFGAGFLAPFATTFLSGTAQSFLLNLGAGASLTFGAFGAWDSFGNGNAAQGIFRLGTGFLGAYGLRRTAIRPTKAVNIGGEGEVPNVINLQLRSALGRNYGRSRPTPSGQPAGRSLAGMLLEGHDFQIYNATKGKLPYATGSVPKVYTNNLPIGTSPGGHFPNVSRAEIIRILKPGGQWVRDGAVYFTKPQ